MNTWIYLGIALLASGGAAVALTAMASSGTKRFEQLFPRPRRTRARSMATAALGGADAVDLASQSGMQKPVSRRPSRVSLRPRGVDPS